MALDATKLHRVYGGPSIGLLVYDAGADAIATVTGSGYFNAYTTNLRKGDIILVVGNSQASIDSIIVTSATGAATVTTSATEGVTAT
jgi:hypothetical protein